MAREAIRLTVEKHGNGIRYRKMFKGSLWVSTVFDQDSRRNRSEAWAAFVLWRAERKRELEAAAVESDRDRKAWEIVTDKIRQTMDQLESADTPDNRRDWEYWQQALQKVRTAVEQGQRYFDHSADPNETVYGKTVEEHRQDTMRKVFGRDPFERRDGEPTTADGIPADDWDDGDWQREVPIVVPEPEKPSPKLPPWKRRKVDPTITARAVADRYLSTLKAKVNSGQASTGQYGVKRNAIEQFVTWYGEGRGLDTLNEADVVAFYEHLAERIEKGENPTTLATYHGKIKQFLDDVAEDTPDIPRPANLRSKRYTIKPGKAKVETFTVAECQSLLELASDRVELWLLLMLNCGMTQQDLSDLQGNEVDWTAGRIVRARSKEANAPTINWPLWGKTFDLLKEQGNRTGTVLLKQDGGKLVTAGIKTDGMEWRRDAVVASWRHLVEKAKRHEAVGKDWHKTLKQFRKTGATLIEQSPHAEFVDMFLDHSRVARQHYLAGQIVPKFDEAVRWLGKELAIG